MTASAPSVTLSAVPPAASWSVPISVGVDELRPHATYLFEVSAFTSDGEGQVASYMSKWVVFCALWGIGGSMNLQTRTEFGEELRSWSNAGMPFQATNTTLLDH